MTTIKAADHLDTRNGMVDSAMCYADAVLAGLATQTAVEVDFTGIKGLSSSYYNVLFKCVADRYGLDAIEARLVPRFDNQAQATVYQRCLQAIGRAAA